MVRKTPHSVEFTHTVHDPRSGYGYEYKKIVSLTRGKPQMVLAHTLRNTGKKPIVSTVYNHNFLTLDKQPPSPDYVLTFPFQLEAGRPLNAALGEIRGNQIHFNRTFARADRFSGRFTGFSAASLALRQLSTSGPWPAIRLCRLMPPGAKPSALAS